MLSPAEQSGLSGAALETRVRRAALHLGDAELARVARRLEADATAHDVVYERDGVREAVRIMLRPLLVMPEQLSYVQRVCLEIVDALKRLPGLYLADPRIRRVVAVTEAEEGWLRDTWTERHAEINPVYGRLDAVCDFSGAGWQDSLHFMEPNLAGVGGIHFAPLAEQLVLRDIVPTLSAHDPGLAIELPLDQRSLFVQVLIDHARAIGRPASRLCFVEPLYVHDGPDEQAVLSKFLAERHGLAIAHADPRDLRIVGDEVHCGDQPVDVAYRDYELRELIALEGELGRPLDAMRLLFRQNRVVSSLVGDFDHKSCWEVLTDPAIAEGLFGAEACRLFRRHVLWTRVLSDRRTTLPHLQEGDLLDYVRRHREQLVLKPNRDYGGHGVTLGAAVAAGEWEALIETAAAAGADPERSWVVQAATRLPVHDFPLVGPNGRAFSEPFYTVMGFAATDNGLGILARVSQKQVVNVAQHGGLAAVLIGHPPADLRAPKRASGGADAAAALRARVAELRHLDQAIALLGWDEETMLPEAGRRQRGDQLATLEGLRHGLLASDRLGDLIEAVAEQRPDDADWGRELALLRRLRDHAIALPESLVRAFACARSESLGCWEEARRRDDYALFAPAFGRLMGLVSERAAALAEGDEPYDALLDEHEPGLTRQRLEPVLGALGRRLAALLPEAAEASAARPGALAGRRFAEAGQWEFCRLVLASLGFDFGRGRLDRSTHPFTLFAGADDVRMTIRVREEDVTAAVLTTLHEGGHGLYDQGFRPEDRDSLLGEAPGMALHEAQARLWENHVGRSLSFWQHWLPTLRRLFPEAAAGLQAEDLHRAVNTVRAGVNRVGADEISYHLHIVLRCELELALLHGDLAIADLPGAWRERSRALLGVAPAGDREGVLQDVHWALGMLGYFPTYTVGSLYAAQLAEAYGRERPLQAELAAGACDGLLGWLRGRVHRIGHRLPAEAILAQAAGGGLDPAAFFRHLAAAGHPVREA
jgi:carboxypeptidase Taq